MDMRISDSIVTLVEFALPRFSPEDKLFHLTVSARMSVYGDDGDDGDRDEYRMIHFLFQRPGNYTKVFVAIEDYEYRIIPDDNFHRRKWVQIEDGLRAFHPSELNNLHWYMTCDHDSCWRSDGVGSVLNQIRQDMMEKIMDGDDKLRGKVHQHHNICSFSQPRFVQAELAVDEEASQGRNDTYMKKPINITERTIEDE